MSRIRVFVLLATVAILATAIAACGGGGGSSAQGVIDDATLSGIHSGTIETKIGIKSEGKSGGDLAVTVSGPFQSGGKDSLPKFDLSATAEGQIKGEAVNLDLGLILLSDRAYVEYKGTEYEVDPTTFGFVKGNFEQAQLKGGEEPGVNACQDVLGGAEVADFVENLKEEGSADVDGTETTKISADLNAGAAADAVIKLTEDPACLAQLETAGPLPLDELESARDELETAIKKAHVDIYVGDDNIIRKLDAEVTIVPKKAETGKVEIAFELSLAGVNEAQKIAPPAKAAPLEDLFNKLGINPLDLLEGSSGGIGGLLEGLGEEGGIGGLLEGLGDSVGGSSGGGSAGQGKDTVECLEQAQTSADLQKCASLS